MKKTILICTGLLAAATLSLFAGEVLSIAEVAARPLIDFGPLLAFVAFAGLVVLSAKVWPQLNEAVHAGLAWCVRLKRDLAMQRREMDVRLPLRQSGFGPVWA